MFGVKDWAMAAIALYEDIMQVGRPGVAPLRFFQGNDANRCHLYRRSARSFATVHRSLEKMETKAPPPNGKAGLVLVAEIINFDGFRNDRAAVTLVGPAGGSITTGVGGR